MSASAYPDDQRTQHVTAPRSRQAPGIVAPTTRLNVALPFSKITVEEPRRDVAELAAIVADLAAAMEKSAPEPSLPELRKRAEAVAARLR
jgi:hypothetical protein